MNKNPEDNRIRINDGIKARELRVISEDGNLGVISREEALAKANEMGLDLIEISPTAEPPVAKIMDYGKFQYEQKKKAKEAKARSKGTVEVKSVQIKVGTGSNDMAMKAKKADEWLAEGHRIKIELYLKGRAKGLEKEFLHDRIRKYLDILVTPYNVVEDFRVVPKGISVLIEKDRKGITTNTNTSTNKKNQDPKLPEPVINN